MFDKNLRKFVYNQDLTFEELKKFAMADRVNGPKNLTEEEKSFLDYCYAIYNGFSSLKGNDGRSKASNPDPVVKQNGLNSFMDSLNDECWRMVNETDSTVTVPSPSKLNYAKKDIGYYYPQVIKFVLLQAGYSIEKKEIFDTAFSSYEKPFKLNPQESVSIQELAESVSKKMEEASLEDHGAIAEEVAEPTVVAVEEPVAEESVDEIVEEVVSEPVEEPVAEEVSEPIPVEEPLSRPTPFKGGSAFVENNVIVKKNGETATTLKQRVTMHGSAEHEIEFVTELAMEGSDSKTATTIFSVDKVADEYGIVFSRLDIFKDNEGKSILDVIPHTDGETVLKLAPDTSKISLSTNGEELEFTFTGTDGKNYKITTGATSISIDYDGQTFEYSTNNETAIDVNMHPNTVEAFLDKENKLFETPSRISDFPAYMIGLFGRQLEGNSQYVFGDYTITSVKNQNDNQPFIFLSKQAKGPKTMNYFYVDGQLKKCTGKFLYQQGEVAGEKVLSLVVETAATKRPKKGELPKLNYYSIPIELTSDGKIAKESVEGIELLSDAFHPTVEDPSDEEASTYESETNASQKYNFYRKDDRAYTAYDYRLKPKNFTVEDSRSISDEAAEPTPVSPSPTPTSDKSGDDTEEKEEKKESSTEPETVEEPKKVSWKAGVEHVGWMGFIAAAFLIVAAMLTGVGALCIIGAILGVTSVTAVTFADKFVYEEPMRKAKKKLSKLEKQEAEDDNFVEYFAAQETSLDMAEERATQAEASLSDLLASENEPIQNFTEAYNEYGVGFEGMLEAEQTRVDALTSYNGLARKQKMAQSLQQISSSTNPEERNKLITGFINTHFEDLPQEQESQVRELFAPENRTALVQLTSSLATTVAAQEAQAKIYEKQKERLAQASDRRIVKLAQTPAFDSAQRKTFFERYSTTIVRHYATKRTSQESISRLVDGLKAQDKGVALEILNKTCETLDKRMKNVGELAKDNQAKKKQIKDCQAYVRALSEIEKQNLATLALTEQNAQEYFTTATALYHTPNSKTQETVHGIVSEVEGLKNKFADSTKGQEVAVQMLEVLSTSSPEITSAYKNMLKVAEEEKLYETIVKLYKENITGGILPDLSNIKVTNKYTLEEISEQLGNDKLQQAVRAYQETRRAQVEEMGKKFEKLVDSLAELDSEIGFAPSISSIEIDHEVKRLQSNAVMKSFEPDLQKKIALANIKARKIESAETTDAISEDIKGLYKQVGVMTEVATSGKLSTLTVDSAVKEATGIETEVNTETLKLKAITFETSVQEYKNVVGIAVGYAKGEDAQQIIDKFNEAGLDADAKAELKKLFVEKYGSDKLNPNMTFEQVVAQLTVDDKIDMTKAEEFLAQETKLVNRHSKANLHTMDNDLGKDFANSEYARATDAISSGEPEEERYDTPLDILVKRFGLNESAIKEVVLSGIDTTKGILDKFGIKEEEYKKYAKNIRSNAYTQEEQFEIWKAEEKLSNLEKAMERLTSAWNQALEGNEVWLEDIIRNQLKDYQECFDRLGIDANKIKQILEQPENTSSLQALEDKQKVSSAGLKVLDKEKEKLEEKKELFQLHSAQDRELFKQRKVQKKFEDARKEFKAKTDVIQSMTDKELRQKALKAFVEGDYKFFETHGIKCEGFEFNEDDKELFEILNIDGKKLLKSKNIYKKLAQISADFAKRSQDLAKQVKTLEKITETPTKDGADIDKVQPAEAKDNISILGTIFSKLFSLHKKAEEERAAADERVPVAEAEAEESAEREETTEETREETEDEA